MTRLSLGIALFLELVLAATLGLAVGRGNLDLSVGEVTLLVIALVLAAALGGRLLPLANAARLVTHGALLAGCGLFSFPFIWLVGTSFKYDEEIFVYPPRWVPGWPAQVDASPYVTLETVERLEPPATVSRERWGDLWKQLEPELWGRGTQLLPAREIETVRAQVLRPVLTRALLTLAVPGVPTHTWQEPDEEALAALLARIDAPMAASAWDAIRRSLALRDLTVRDTAYDTHMLPGGSQLARWQPASGDARLLASGADQLAPTLDVAYDFRDSRSFTLSGEFPLPISAEEFLSFTLPIHQDRSWHRLLVELELGGVRYVGEDRLYLGQHRWQELSFKLATRDDRDEGDLGIWPLVPASDHAGALTDAAHFRVRLCVERAGPMTALWRKYTSNYRSAYIATQHRWLYVGNSVLLAVLTIAGQALSCSMVAYAFSRLRWPGRDLLFGVLLATMMLPGQVTMIPVFMIFRQLGWYNTLQALWVPSLFGSAFFIFMLRQFMRGIPTDLEDAARIDGCSVFGIYWRVILPLVKPALAAVCIFTFMNTWNDFMGPLIYLNDQRLYPLAMVLFDFRSQHSSEFGMLMAASTLMTLPVIAIFFLAQRYFIQGVTLTGMKG